MVFRPEKGKDITRLYEVETEDSVDEEEVNQWETYNNGPSGFYLVVPEGAVDEARNLVRDAELSIAGIYYYDSDLRFHLA